MKIFARYDLACRIANFEFFNWLLLAKAHGAGGVVFGVERVKTSKWSEGAIRRRFASIIEPGPALAGMEMSIGEGGRDFGPTHLRRLVAHCRGGGRIDKLRSVLLPGAARYTVTLRRTARRPERNSNEPAWRSFAAEIGALVIEDWDIAPIGLHERVALYAGARLNFFVTNGPMQLCSFTEYPMLCFGCQAAEGAFSNIGIAAGEQFPWCGPRQRLVWEPDELPVLRRAFSQWREEHEEHECKPEN